MSQDPRPVLLTSGWLLAAARGRKGERGCVRKLSAVLCDNGAVHGRHIWPQWIAGQPFGWPARASRRVGRSSHPQGRSANRDRGEPRGSSPPTPPCVRGRTRRFDGVAGRSGSARAVRASVPWAPALRASPFAAGSKASSNWMFCRLVRMSVAVLLTLSVVRAFAGEPATMPSADFCAAVTGLADPLSPGLPDTAQTSRGKTDRLHRIPAGFTTPALDGCGLRDSALARPAG